MIRFWVALTSTLVLFGLANACPPPWHCYRPGPVAWGQLCYPPPGYVIYQPCCPPPVYYGPHCRPAQVVRIVVVAPTPPVSPPTAAEEPRPPQKAETVKKPEMGPKPRIIEPLDAPVGWCHITGRVVFDGERIPERKEIRNSGGAYTEDWVVNSANRGVQNVVVWLAPEPSEVEMNDLRSRKRRDFPSFKAESIHPNLTRIGQNVLRHEGTTRAYYPHVLALQAGSDVLVRNASPVPINPKWVSRNNGEVNPLVPPGKSQLFHNMRAERFPIRIEDSIHPAMNAYIRVFEHPYFAVTDADGKFEIKFAPKGKLRLFVWQKTNGFRNGAEGRFGEAIELPSGRHDLGNLKILKAVN